MSVYALSIALLLINGVAALLLALMGWRRRALSGSRAYVAMMLLVALWSFALTVALFGPSPTLFLILRKLKFLAIVLLPVAWFVFAADYTMAYSLRRWHYAGLLLIPAISLLLITAQPLRTAGDTMFVLSESLAQVLSDYPLLIFAQMIYSYVLLFAGIYLLASLAIRSMATYRDQARRILWTVTIPLVSLLLGMVGPLPLPIDLMPVAFTLSGALALVFLLRTDPLPLFGLSYEAIIGNMPDGVAVLDRNDVVMTVNPRLLHFSDAFTESSLVGKSVDEAFAYWPPLLDRIRRGSTDTDTDTEFQLGERYVDLVISGLKHPKGHAIGRILVFRDVTSRKQSELALLANERRYLALFETNNDAIFIIDLDWTIILANQQAATMLETSYERILHASTTDFMPAEEHTFSNNRMMRLLAGEVVPLYERNFLRPNGSVFPTEINLTLVRDANGEPIHIQMVVRDISTRKEAEAALAAERNRLQTLLDTVPDEVVMKGADGSYTLANAAFLQRVGLTLDELIGKTDEDFLEAEQADEIMIDDQITLQSGRTFTREQLIAFGDVEEPQWYANTRAPLKSADEQISGLVTISRNISESKSYQKALQASVEQLAVLRQVDEEVNSTLKVGHVTLVALDAALRLSGADAGFIAVSHDDVVEIVHQVGAYQRDDNRVLPEKGIVGRTLVNLQPAMLLSAQDDPDYIPYIAETRALMVIPLISQTRLVGVLNLETRDPKRFNEEIFQFIQLVANRVSIALDNARLHDYVRRQLAELQNIHAELSKLEKLKTDMIRIASHDLKNPLGIINGYLAMLEFDRDMFSEEHLGYFDAMERSVVRMVQMLEDILSLEAIQQRASGTNTTYLHLNEMVQRAVEEYAPQAQSKHQIMDVDIHGQPVWVRGDEAQLYEAIANIISNAIKYTPEAGHLAVQLKAERGEIAMFNVQDSGYGIPEDRQERLFEPFYRAQAEGTEEIEGTGLGLHLVKNIVERHNGSMIFSSVFGEGSQFGFHLPLSSRDELEAARLI